MTWDKIHFQPAVRRNHADVYLLAFLVAFAATVIITRTFLELTGYPQIGNDVLHIAHALWGGLLLLVAVLLPLAFANRWPLQASALLGGVGTGLFIDEVGKFITQANDYFYPPSLPIIYGFFLLTVSVYLALRRPQQKSPRQAMYCALERLQDVLERDLDTDEATWIAHQLSIARRSDQDEIVSLANAIDAYICTEWKHLPTDKPDHWVRIANWVDTLGHRLGRSNHRTIISVLLILGTLILIGNTVTTAVGTNLGSQITEWRVPLVVIQSLVAACMVIATIAWLRKNEARGLGFSTAGFCLSLVALQLLHFYVSQFAAITATLIQLACLQILMAYRRWHL